MSNSKKILASVKVKPYFSEGFFTLYKGDCLDILSQLPENSVDMIFADPPYNLSNGGFTVHAGRRVSVNKGEWDVSKGFQKDFNFHLAWIEACKRVLKPSGTIWVSGTYHSIYQCGAALQMLDYKILNDIAWYKPNAAPNLSCRYFTASHETLLWARKDKKAKHTFNYEVMKNWQNNYRINVTCECGGCRKKCEKKVEPLHKEGKQMRSVWGIMTPRPEEKKFKKHPTQKPVALLERIIQASTNRGDIVLDPFTGSSTTGLVASKYGRKFAGIDTEKDYLDLSIKRLKNN